MLLANPVCLAVLFARRRVFQQISASDIYNVRQIARSENDDETRNTSGCLRGSRNGCSGSRVAN